METTWGCAKLQLVNRSLRAQAYLSTSTKMTGAYRNTVTDTVEIMTLQGRTKIKATLLD